MADSGDSAQDLSLAEAVALTGMPPAMLERWAAAGRITSRLGEGGQRTFRRADLLVAWTGRDPASDE